MRRTSRAADLTAIAALNGDPFPSNRLVDAITNGSNRITAHGSEEMPVWGPIFSGLDASGARNRMRIQNIV